MKRQCFNDLFVSLGQLVITRNNNFKIKAAIKVIFIISSQISFKITRKNIPIVYVGGNGSFSALLIHVSPNQHKSVSVFSGSCYMWDTDTNTRVWKSFSTSDLLLL